MRRSRVAVLLGAAVLAATAASASAAPTAAWVPTLPMGPASSFRQLSALPDGTAWVFDARPSSVPAAAPRLWRSTDRGLTWQQVGSLPPATSPLAQARFATPTTGWLTDETHLFRTTDAGASWQRLPGPPSAPGDTFHVGPSGLWVGGSTVVLAGTEYGPVRGTCAQVRGDHVWTSHDGGVTWVDVRFSVRKAVAAVRYLDARTGVVLVADTERIDALGPCFHGGTRATVYVTHDGGRRFSRSLACGGTGCLAAAFVTPRRLLVGLGDGSLRVSDDGGRTFRPGPPLQTSLVGGGITAFASSGRAVFAVTPEGDAYLSPDLGRTWTHEVWGAGPPLTGGWGDVAAFDAEHAIAGGPSYVATRTLVP